MDRLGFPLEESLGVPLEPSTTIGDLIPDYPDSGSIPVVEPVRSLGDVVSDILQVLLRERFPLIIVLRSSSQTHPKLIPRVEGFQLDRPSFWESHRDTLLDEFPVAPLMHEETV